MIKKGYKEKTAFQERFESKTSQELISKMKPNIIKIAILIIDKEKENSIKNYFKSDKNLTVQWIPCDEFIAYADIDELGGIGAHKSSHISTPNLNLSVENIISLFIFTCLPSKSIVLFIPTPDLNHLSS
jgi:hypothetical protein